MRNKAPRLKSAPYPHQCTSTLQGAALDLRWSVKTVYYNRFIYKMRSGPSLSPLVLTAEGPFGILAVANSQVSIGDAHSVLPMVVIKSQMLSIFEEVILADLSNAWNFP